MDKILLTQIIGVSFIFIIVAVIALVNITQINYHLSKRDKDKKKEIMNKNEQKISNVYELNKRKRS